MPSPIGHILGGMTVRRVIGSDAGLIETAILSTAADLDFLPGLARDEANRYHGSATHSLTAALLVGIAFGLTRRNEKRRGLTDGAVIYGSHLLLDALGKELSDGLPLFWPFYQKRYAVPGSKFRTIHRRPGLPFVRSLYHRGNRRAVMREVRVLLPVYLAARLLVR